MAIASPCVRKCCLNEDDICLGCYRSLEEIKHWSASVDKKKLEILSLAETRRSKGRHRFGFTE
jgi:uncharacterized protein